MALFKIEREDSLLKIDFGDEPGDNDAIVAEVGQTLKSVDLTGGGTLRINGSASLPVAMVISHAVAHLFKEIACYDPKLGKYVVVISHGGAAVGSLID